MKRVATTWLSLSLFVCFVVTPPMSGGQSKKAAVLLQEKDQLRLSNGTVELVLDRRSGHFRQIRNLVTGAEHKLPEDGVWPFGLWLGTRNEPQQQVAEITADGVQKVRYRGSSGAEQRYTLQMEYPDLQANATRRPTGVGLSVAIELAPGRDYFVIQATLRNRGPGQVTNFYAGKGKLQAGPGARLMSSNGPGKPASILGYAPYLIAGWFDYSEETGGIGIGYINPQLVKTVFDTASGPDGAQVSWRTFNLKGMWHFEKLLPPEQNVHIYPLQPGESFQTGPWILAPHAGDWHRMADIYREHYAPAFRGDYLRWEDVPPRARQAHLQACFWVGGEEQRPDGKWIRTLHNSFADVVQMVEKVIQKTGIRPENVAVMMNGQWERPITRPDYFPINVSAGGEAGLAEATRRLQDELRVGSLMYYVHPWYNHPDAQLYVKDADSGHTFGVGGSHYACQQNKAWAAVWRDQLLPKFRALRTDAFYLDEGAMRWGICEKTGPGHLHGLSALDLLRQNAAGGAMIQRLMREGLGPGSFLMTEGGNDLEGRWVDIWQHFSAPQPHYTHPEHIYAIYYDNLSKREWLNEGVVNGFLPQVNLYAKKPLDEEAWANLRRVVEVRRALADAKAPGYPQGFRDDVGLTLSDPTLSAKAFSSPEGITVTYYAPKPLDAEITVDGAMLGHVSLGKVQRRVTTDPLKTGFFVLQAKQGK